LDVTFSLELLDEHYRRSLIGVINRYHRSINKTHLGNIQHHWLDKLLYLVILIDEYRYLE